MKVLVDLEPVDVWRIQDAAQRRHITPGEVLRDDLAKRRHALRLRERIRSLVTAGKCDADIGIELGMTSGAVASLRRGMALPANRRYTKKEKTA